MTVRLDHHFFWLANRNDALYRSNGSILVPAVQGGARSAYIGNEIDWQLLYRPSPYVTFGEGIGCLFPGGFLKETTAGAARMLSYLILEFKL